MKIQYLSVIAALAAPAGAMAATEGALDWTYRLQFTPEDRLSVAIETGVIPDGFEDTPEGRAAIAQIENSGGYFPGPLNRDVPETYTPFHGGGADTIPVVKFRNIPVGETPWMDMFFFASFDDFFYKRKPEGSEHMTGDVVSFCDNFGCAAWIGENISRPSSEFSTITDVSLSDDLAATLLPMMGWGYGIAPNALTEWRNPFLNFAQTAGGIVPTLTNPHGEYSFRVVDGTMAPRVSAFAVYGGSSDTGMGLHGNSYSLGDTWAGERGRVDWEVTIKPSVAAVAPVPLPPTAMLMLGALVGLVSGAIRRKGPGRWSVLNGRKIV